MLLNLKISSRKNISDTLIHNQKLTSIFLKYSSKKVSYPVVNIFSIKSSGFEILNFIKFKSFFFFKLFYLKYVISFHSLKYNQNLKTFGFNSLVSTTILKVKALISIFMKLKSIILNFKYFIHKYLKFKIILFNFIKIEIKEKSSLFLLRKNINKTMSSLKNINFVKYISFKNSFKRLKVQHKNQDIKDLQDPLAVGFNSLNLKLFFKLNIIKFYKYNINLFFQNPAIKFFFTQILSNEILIQKNIRFDFLKYEFLGHEFFKSKLFHYLKNALFLHLYKFFNKEKTLKRIENLKHYFKYKNLILKKYFFYFSFLKFWVFKFFLNKYDSALLNYKDILTNSVSVCYEKIKIDIKNLFLVNYNFMKSKFFVYHSSFKKFKNMLLAFFPKKYNLFYHLYYIKDDFFYNDFDYSQNMEKRVTENSLLEKEKIKNKRYSNYTLFKKNLQFLKKTNIFLDKTSQKENELSNYKLLNEVTLQLQKMLFVNITIARNNVFFTILTTAGRVLYKCSAGCYGFRNKKRREIFAVTQAARFLGLKIKKLAIPSVFLNLKVSLRNKFVKSLLYGFKAAKITFSGIIYSYNRPFTSRKLKKLRRV